eukprot:gene11617-14225_t
MSEPISSNSASSTTTQGIVHLPSTITVSATVHNNNNSGNHNNHLASSTMSNSSSSSIQSNNHNNTTTVIGTPSSPSISRLNQNQNQNNNNTNVTSSSSSSSSSNTTTTTVNAVVAPTTTTTATASGQQTTLQQSQSQVQHPNITGTLSLPSGVVNLKNESTNYHAEEFQAAMENKKTLKKLLKVSKHWNESMKNYCQNCHLFSDELVKQSDKLSGSNLPRDKNLNNALSSFGNTLKAVNSVHDQMLNEIQDVFWTPLNNFVDYDFAEVVESNKRVTKCKEDYDQALGKISASIKKSKTGIDETRLFNYEQELEKLKDILEGSSKDLEGKLEELAHKNETKYLKSLLLFINAQFMFFQRGSKLFANLKPKIEDIERYLEEIQPPKVVEGHLMKKSKQVMGGWNKCWYVLKDGMLYCYKGKKEFHPENALNILLCSVRLPQVMLSSPSATNQPPTKEQNEYRFEILHPRKKQPIVLQAENEEERDRWVNAIQEAISNSLNSQPLEKSSSFLNSSLLGGKSSHHHPQTNSLSNNHHGGAQQSDEVNQQVLRILQKVGGNNICADCDSPDPDWASINLGILICKTCSGVHRSLGTHISKVRSLTLDKWSPENIWFMKEVGNTKFNLLFEHHTSDQVKPTEKSDRATKEQWIRAKYKNKEFIVKSALPQEELSKMLHEMIQTGQRDVVRYIKLIGQGAEVNYCNTEGRTSLHHSVFKSDDVLIPELLLQNGADLTLADPRGWTAMHYAAFFNRPRCTTLFMKRGFENVRTKCRDHLGRLALDLAIINMSKESELILKGDEIDTGINMDNIENNSIPTFEATTPLSTDFPSGSSTTTTILTSGGACEEILSEDEDDEPIIVTTTTSGTHHHINEMESTTSWNSECESVGRSSFSAPETIECTVNLISSNNSSSNLHQQLLPQITTSNSQGNLTSSNTSNSTSASMNNLANQSSTGNLSVQSNNHNNNSSSNNLGANISSSTLSSNNSSTASLSLEVPPNGNSSSSSSTTTNTTSSKDPKANRPKSKRRPSILGRGRNTLKLMRNKLTMSGKNAPGNTSSGSLQNPQVVDDGEDDDDYDSQEMDDQDHDQTVNSNNNNNNNNENIGGEKNTGGGDESADEISTSSNSSSVKPTLPQSNSTSTLEKSDSEEMTYNENNTNSNQQSQQNTVPKSSVSPVKGGGNSPTPFKKFFKKLITNKKKDKDSGSTLPNSSSQTNIGPVGDNESEIGGDIPDNVSVSTNEDSLKSEDHNHKSLEKKQSKDVIKLQQQNGGTVST